MFLLFSCRARAVSTDSESVERAKVHIMIAEHNHKTRKTQKLVPNTRHFAGGTSLPLFETNQNRNIWSQTAPESSLNE